MSIGGGGLAANSRHTSVGQLNMRTRQAWLQIAESGE